MAIRASWVCAVCCSVLLSGMAWAGGECVGALAKSVPESVAGQSEDCPQRYAFETLDLALCRSGSGLMSLSVLPKGGSGAPRFERELGDAYAIRPLLFRSAAAGCDSVLVVEHGAEFSYGSLVLLLGKHTIEYLGTIDLVASQDGDSVAPHIAVRRDEDGSLTFSLDIDAYRPTAQGDYEKIAPAQSSYRYDGKRGFGLR